MVVSSFKRSTSNRAFKHATPSNSLAHKVSDVNSVVPRPEQSSGVKSSLNNQRLISTGLSAVDEMFGGGLPLAALLVIDSPSIGSFGFDMMRYFSAEGIVSNQKTILYGCSESNTEMNVTDIVDSLPLELSQAKYLVSSSKEKEQTNSSTAVSDSGKLSIAWQYEKYLASNKALSASSTSIKSSKARFCHSYDLSKKLQSVYLQRNPPLVVDLSMGRRSSGRDMKSRSPRELYADIVNDLQQNIEECLSMEESFSDETRSELVLRACIHDVGSISYGAPSMDHAESIVAFLRSLRRLFRKYKSSAISLSVLASVPTWMYEGNMLAALKARIVHESDYVISFTSLSKDDCIGDELDIEEIEGFDALCQVQKIPRVHSLGLLHTPQTVQYGVKRERRKLKIEKMHLPPAGSRSASSAQTNASIPVNSSSCGTGSSGDHKASLSF